MLHRRIAYAGALGAAVLFQILFEGYLSTFLLVLTVLFPLLALALSLPGMLGCALTLAPEAAQIRRGEAGRFLLSLSNRLGQPLSQVVFCFTSVNLMTGERHTSRQVLRGVSRGSIRRETVPGSHCGQVEAAVTRARVCDLLGLFTLPLPCPPPASLLVLPAPVDIEAPPECTGERQAGVRLRPRPGGGPGEDYDLRSYRPGDPMKNVHWKLSTKRDELVVREVLEPCRAELILTFDHFGPAEDLDRTLDRLWSLSRWLLEREQVHRIQWVHPESGRLEDFPVAGEAGLIRAFSSICSIPAPAQGRSILDAALRAPGGTRHLHVTPDGLEGGGPR